MDPWIVRDNYEIMRSVQPGGLLYCFGKSGWDRKQSFQSLFYYGVEGRIHYFSSSFGRAPLFISDNFFEGNLDMRRIRQKRKKFLWRDVLFDNSFSEEINVHGVSPEAIENVEESLDIFIEEFFKTLL